MSTLIHKFVAQARAGELARVVTKMPCGWLTLGDPQVLNGYCVLYPDPVVPNLNTLVGDARAQFLSDMVRAGDALVELLSPARVNYEILGNAEPALHAHIVPRYESEPDEFRTKPVFFYDFPSARPFNPDLDRELLESLRARLQA